MHTFGRPEEMQSFVYWTVCRCYKTMSVNANTADVSTLYCWLNIKCTSQVLTRRKWRVGINYVSQLALLQDHLDSNTALCSLGNSVEVHILDTEHVHAQSEIIMPLFKLRLFTILSKRVSSYFIWWKSLSDFMKLLQMTRLGGRTTQPWSSATDVIWSGWG